MFTDCPDCGRQFRVRADQISAASGEVRCGFCGRQFNVLNRLRDAPLAAVPEPVAALPDPEFDIPPPAPARPRPTRPPVVPPELAPEPVPHRPPGHAAWRAAALLLVLAAAVQIAWFQRDLLIGRYPELRPWVERLCGRIGCEVLEFRDLSAIQLVNRDVRLHPLYEDSLLVNATIRNGAAKAQAWPFVQLVLFDTNGRPIAQRSFAPHEYLDASIDARLGMQPQSSAHFVLEITGATTDAVSFEFGFL
jgi:predicted Zn finger-like uncharacterized protein